MRFLAFCIALFILLLRVFFYFESQPHYIDGQEVVLEGMVTQEPRQFSGRQIFEIDGVTVFTTSRPEFHYGDTVRVKGKVSCRKDSGQARMTDSSEILKPSVAKAMQGKQVQDDKVCEAVIYFPEIAKLKDGLGEGFGALRSYKEQVGWGMRKVLPESSASLLSGIVFGSKEGFSQELSDAFKVTGTTHIIAASGMNVTLFTVFLLSFLSYFLNRRIAAGVVIVLVILYAFLAQLSPSIVRASIMGILVLVASIIGRQAKPLYLLFIAVYLMIFISPEIVGDIGFQLSVAATAGLVLFSSIFPSIDLYRSTQKEKLALKNIEKIPLIGQDLLTTIIAQISTLPLLVFHFGSISVVSIIVNLLVLWTVPILMAVGFLFGMIWFVPVISHFLLLVCLPLLLYFEWIIMFFNKPQFVLLVEEVPWMVVVGYYCLLLGIYFRITKEKSEIKQKST